MVSKTNTRRGNSVTEPEKENDGRGVASYELAREQRIKENLERMHKLGIVELSRNLKPTKTIRPYKHKPPPSPNSRRSSSRIQTIPTVDYSHKRVFKAPEVVKIERNPCHQCRKNSSIHTNCCKCKALQGQFCGRCLIIRYGENILEAKKNPDWVCFVCRDICNCIHCRKVKGWKPLGSVYWKAMRLGFKSVAHYLKEFQGPNGKLNDMDDKTYEEDDELDDKDDDDDDDDDDDNDDDSKHVLSEEDLKHEDHSQQSEGEKDGDNDFDYESSPLDDDKLTLMMMKKILKVKKRSKNDH